MARRAGNCFPKRWEPCYPNFTEYMKPTIFNISLNKISSGNVACLCLMYMPFEVIRVLFVRMKQRKQSCITSLSVNYSLKHYENTPIQLYRKFHSKNWKFSDKKLRYFSYFCLKHRLWYSLEPPRRGGSNEYPQSMFSAEIRKIMYTPVNPSFTI